jgi:6-phosphofructokinase 1
MPTKVKRIGISTGGGDCPGLNAVIRGVVKAAQLEYGWSVTGIGDGFDGLIWPEKSREIGHDDVRGILDRGGTILGTTNRGNPFDYEVEENGQKVRKDFSGLCIENAKKMGLDAMVVIGGDGTLKIGHDFYQLGLPVVGVPKTIDNDLSVTEMTFGFMTAVQTATEALDKLQTTAESHHRVMIMEVMGRDAGWIAIQAGLAGKADIILIPEIPFTIEAVCEKIHERESLGRLFTVIVIQVGTTLAYSLRCHTHKEIRVTVLGHLQRGGTPTAFDRILGLRFGVAAVDLIAKGEFGQMVCLKSNEIRSTDIKEAIGVYNTVDPDCGLVRTARGLGITFGN